MMSGGGEASTVTTSMSGETGGLGLGVCLRCLAPLRGTRGSGEQFDFSFDYLWCQYGRYCVWMHTWAPLQLEEAG